MKRSGRGWAEGKEGEWAIVFKRAFILSFTEQALLPELIKSPLQNKIFIPQRVNEHTVYARCWAE